MMNEAAPKAKGKNTTRKSAIEFDEDNGRSN
jgi:hypothetical protein